MLDSRLLQQMRELRGNAARMNQTLVRDHGPFLNPYDNLTFFRLPSRPPENRKDLGVTPTCTAFMALALSGQWDDFYSSAADNRGHARKEAKSGVVALLGTNWETAKLDPNNAFTTSLVLRASGMLHNARHLTRNDLNTLLRTQKDEEINPKTGKKRKIADPYRQFHERTVSQIAVQMAKSVPESLRVQNYPPTPTIAYWLLDAGTLPGCVNRETGQHPFDANWPFAVDSGKSTPIRLLDPQAGTSLSGTVPACFI